MIVEGLVTTVNANGGVNVAPQGPIVTGDFAALQFRPFPGSATYDNLHRTRSGVFHITDDVLLLVQTALNLPHPPPAVRSAEAVHGAILADCCRWYEFRVETVDESGERPLMTARVVSAGRSRDPLGYNRAQHAVIEATIAATRLHLLPAAEVRAELDRCCVRVEKTGGPREKAAYALVRRFVEQSLSAGDWPAA